MNLCQFRKFGISTLKSILDVNFDGRNDMIEHIFLGTPRDYTKLTLDTLSLLATELLLTKSDNCYDDVGVSKICLCYTVNIVSSL